MQAGSEQNESHNFREMLVFAFDDDYEPQQNVDSEGEDAGRFSDDSGAYEDCDQVGPLPHCPEDDMPSLLSRYANSLPVTIPGKYWPPPDAFDSVKRQEGLQQLKEGADDADSESDLAYPPHRVPNTVDMWSNLAQSVQPADAPERLFGERPRRRDYHYKRLEEQQKIRMNQNAAKPPPASAATSGSISSANDGIPVVVKCDGEQLSTYPNR